MIKPESNAPASMQPWVDATDLQLASIEDAINRLEVNSGSGSTNLSSVSADVNSSMSFSLADDDSAAVDIANATLVGKAYTTDSLQVGGPLYVGVPGETSVADGLDPDGLPAYTVVELPKVKIDPTYSRTEAHINGGLRAIIPGLNASLTSDGFVLDVSMDMVYANQSIPIYDIVGDGTTATVRADGAELYWYSYYYFEGASIAIDGCGDFDTNATIITAIVTDTEFGYFSFTISSAVVGTQVGTAESYFVGAQNFGSAAPEEQARISMTRPAPTYGYSEMTPAGFRNGTDSSTITTTIDFNSGVTTDQLSVSGVSDFGGGYGATGTTIDDAGNINANGNVTVDGQLDVGGGFGNTGLSILTNGQVQMSANALSLTNGTGSIQIGASSGTNLAFDNNDIQCRLSGAGADIFINRLGGDVFIGNSTRGIGIEGNQVWATGVYGNALTTSYRSMYVSSTDTYDKLGYVASSRDEKKNIEPLSYTAEQILSVQPVQYHYNTEDDASPKHAGMIAEDLHDAGLHGYVSYDKEGKPATINYEFYVSALQQVVRHQADQIASLSARLDALEAR